MYLGGTVRDVGNKSINIKLRIDEATHADLQARAREAERSVAAEIRLAIRNHLAGRPQGWWKGTSA